MGTGKLLIAVGLVLVVSGLFVTFGGKIPFLGKLPGDISIERDGFSFSFPITSCILVSLLLSLLFWLFRR